MLGRDQSVESDVKLQGLFIAEVINDLDPKAIERVRVRVIGVHDMDNKDPENSIWAQHLAPSKGTSGEIPRKGDYVYIMFLQGDPMSPIWLGWVRSIQG